MAEMRASFADPKQELLRLAKQEGNDTCADCGKKGRSIDGVTLYISPRSASRFTDASGLSDSSVMFRRVDPAFEIQVALIRHDARGDSVMSGLGLGLGYEGREVVGYWASSGLYTTSGECHSLCPSRVQTQSGLQSIWGCLCASTAAESTAASAPMSPK